MLANHVVDTIVNRVGLHLKNWLSAQQDRAPTNKTCLREITETFPDANPTNNFCCTHGLSNSGKQIFGKNESTKYARQFKKQWQKIIQYPGKARQRAKVIFREHPKTCGGVRFFVKYEQILQLSKIGLDTIMEEVIPFCISEKVSQESASTLKNMFDNPTEDTESHLAMAMIEMSAVGDGLLPFCESCYTLEGDGQLILRAKSVFDRLDAKINEEWSSLRMTDNFITKVVSLFQVVDDRYCGKIESARNILNETCVNVNSANEKLDHKLNQRNSVTSGGVSRSGRQRTNSGRVTDTDQLESLVIEVAEAKCDLKEMKKI